MTETGMMCIYCGGEMEQKELPYNVDRKGYHLYLEAGPTRVCTRCGERAYEEPAVRSLQAMIQHLEQDLCKVALQG